jgi:hypothetical protein
MGRPKPRHAERPGARRRDSCPLRPCLLRHSERCLPLYSGPQRAVGRRYRKSQAADLVFIAQKLPRYRRDDGARRQHRRRLLFCRQPSEAERRPDHGESRRRYGPCRPCRRQAARHRSSRRLHALKTHLERAGRLEDNGPARLYSAGTQLRGYAPLLAPFRHSRADFGAAIISAGIVLKPWIRLFR